MNIGIAILLILVAAAAGFAGGIFLTRSQVKKMMADNPPLNEDAVRMMMSSMGRKPSETQVQQVFRQIKNSAKQEVSKK
ncbi:hypothetical protein BG262_08715 [Floricoccus penangensis]|uniref:UPF0154 protein BG262_08715 n=1 Tax=Floricoccus penangensis TaxID=1859475 RepID=A0A9Q5JHR3_9LACT|nr:YneF family protein [Floricoccus penangensis]OFI47766.1 hypothetical protein BG262_08715 [Floricoccus penangensis]